jgi:heme/copper-type cytochrome/quinol oxidase subunit 2
MRKFAILLPLGAMLVAAGWFAVHTWLSMEGTEISVHGYIAMTLGILFSLVIGVGLMGLVFYSSRRGYDDAAHHEHPHRKD